MTRDLFTPPQWRVTLEKHRGDHALREVIEIHSADDARAAKIQALRLRRTKGLVRISGCERVAA